MPGKWYVDDSGNICVTNDDGTTSVYPTSWEKERRERIIEKAIEKDLKQERLKEHLLDKRIQKQKDKVRGR